MDEMRPKIYKLGWSQIVRGHSRPLEMIPFVDRIQVPISLP